jgi:hypothetical protein
MPPGLLSAEPADYIDRHRKRHAAVARTPSTRLGFFRARGHGFEYYLQWRWAQTSPAWRGRALSGFRRRPEGRAVR